MEKGASVARSRGRRLGVLAAAVAVAAGTPGVVRANGHNRRGAGARGNSASAERGAHGPVTVALGATGGSERERALLTEALTDAIGQNPGLRLHTPGPGRPAIVLTANVRALVVSHGPAGALASCDVGVVIADGGGAVRAMLDVRRVVHGDARASDDSLEHTALRSAAHGALRDLVSQVLR